MDLPPAFSGPTRVPTRQGAAFTLVELLVVMGIIALLLAMIVPAFTGVRAGGDFIAAASDIGSTMEQARAYAMANNTYVYVGIGEYNVSESTSTSPRSTGPNALGQVVVAVVASRDGTRGYDVNNPASSWGTNYVNAKNGATLLTAIDKLHFYNNLHLADFGSTPPAGGRMTRAAVTSAQYRLGSSTSAASTHLTWPLGNTLDSGQYNFSKVIQIDPQGVARIQTETNTDGIAAYMEIDLQPTHGAAAPAVPSDQNLGNHAALQIDCMTGATRVYHP